MPENWLIQDSQTENNIYNVFFLDREQGWAASWNFEGFFGTLILKTTDGGQNWTGYPYPVDNIFINCILYFDSLTGWMGGSPHAIVKTTDAGISWAQAAVDTTPLAFFPVLNIKFYDENYGYACGGMFDIAGVTWSTSNGGEKWYPIDNADAPADEVHGLHIFDSLTVLGSGGDPDFGYGVGMIRTYDAGMDWSYEELSMQGNAYDLDFVNDTEAWAPLGPRQKLIYSLDAGDTWTEIPSPENTAIFDMIFPDSLHGFAVGDHGAFLKYDATSVGLWDHLDEELTDMYIFPNPCTEFFMIKSKGSPIKAQELSIYSIRGEYISNIRLAGEVVDVEDLPAGMYFVKITYKDQIITRKIIKH